MQNLTKSPAAPIPGQPTQRCLSAHFFSGWKSVSFTFRVKERVLLSVFRNIYKFNTYPLIFLISSLSFLLLPYGRVVSELESSYFLPKIIQI